MGRYTGPICRLCRREGIKLCDKHKCATVRRNYPPGMHGKDGHGKQSDYAKQLREKQKTRRIFGISERQMVRYYTTAIASKGESGEQLLRQMEYRFDNVVYRAGFAKTRRQARQLVGHGIFTLNGKRMTVPSVQVKEGDTFTVREKNRKMPLFENFTKKKGESPKWISVSVDEFTGKVIGAVQKEELDQSIDPQMIIEFYSR